MARTLFFCMDLRKFSEITNKKPIFCRYNTLYNSEFFSFQSAFWSLFNHRQRSWSSQEQCSLCCCSPCFLVLLCTHYGPLQCFSTYFCKLKKIGVLPAIFPDYVISCEYGWNKNQHPPDTICPYFQAKLITLTFSTQICPKILPKMLIPAWRNQHLQVP